MMQKEIVSSLKSSSKKEIKNKSAALQHSSILLNLFQVLLLFITAIPNIITPAKLPRKLIPFGVLFFRASAATPFSGDAGSIDGAFILVSVSYLWHFWSPGNSVFSCFLYVWTESLAYARVFSC